MEPFGRVLGRTWALLGALGRHLEPLWRVLAALGRSWAALGRHLEPLGRVLSGAWSSAKVLQCLAKVPPSVQATSPSQALAVPSHCYSRASQSLQAPSKPLAVPFQCSPRPTQAQCLVQVPDSCEVLRTLCRHRHDLLARTALQVLKCLAKVTLCPFDVLCAQSAGNVVICASSCTLHLSMDIDRSALV